jgi:hypothetical protein
MQNFCAETSWKSLLERHRIRCEGNIRMYFSVLDCQDRWISLAQDRVQWRPFVFTVLNFLRFCYQC